MTIFLVLAVVFSIFAVIFAFQNYEPVTVHFFGNAFDGSLALVLISTLGVGIVIGILGSLPAILRNRIKLNQQKRVINEQEHTIGLLRRNLQQPYAVAPDHLGDNLGKSTDHRSAV